MNDWIAAAGPAAAYDSQAQALKGARWTSLALWLVAAVGVLQVWDIARNGPKILELARAHASVQAQSPEAAAALESMIGPGMIDMMIMTGVGTLAVAMVAGLIQWFRPNRVIPLICLLLAVYGMVSSLVGFMMAGMMGLSATQGASPWSQVLALATAVVTLFLHIAGLRGASALKRLRA